MRILWTHIQRSPATVLNLLSITSETTFGLLLTNKIFSLFLRGETPAKVTSFWLLHRWNWVLHKVLLGDHRNVTLADSSIFQNPLTLGSSVVGQWVARTSVEDGGFNCVSEHYKGFQQLCGRIFLKIGSDVWCWKEFSVSEPTRTVHGFCWCSFLQRYLHHRNSYE